MQTSIRWRWPLMALLAAALFAGCEGLDTQQRKWIFMARAVPASQEQQARDDGMTDVWIEHHSSASGSAVKLHALWMPNDNPRAPALLYLHGARRDIEASAFRIRQMHDLGFSVLAVDYRGFGRSTDELPSEPLVYEDARAAWGWLAKAHPDRPRYIFGHSLGGAIGVQLASEVDDAQGLIVEGTFTSIPEVFQTMKWGWLPITALITQRFDSLSKIERVKAPVLVVHGSRDGLIRPSLGRALYERAKARKKFVLVEGGTHWSTNALGQVQYREAMKELFGLAL
ncbi:MAG TPA: alpha/beta fold hydrolase [Albitalea sp.]|uniref:alpha/beta hydrolase n=1 Tax=Piscinibacter sp. TaxID=1903157 RepID=UPI002ED20557